MTTRRLPPVTDLTEQQLRGWACVWCLKWLSAGTDEDLGEQRVVPESGAAYSWFPRACGDVEECAKRQVERSHCS